MIIGRSKSFISSPVDRANRFFSEAVLLYGLLGLSVIFVYYKASLGLPFFLLLLIWSWFSKKDYFWFAFFFILLQSPGGLFAFYESSHLPFIKFLPGMSLTPIDLFTIMTVVKCIFNRTPMGFKNINFYLKASLFSLFAYFFFAFIYGVLIYGSSIDTIAFFLRTLIYLIWFFTFTALLNSREKIIKFFKLIMLVVFISFFAQIYILITANQLITFFDPATSFEIMKNTLTGEARPVVAGVLALFLGFIGALYLVFSERSLLMKLFSYIVITVSFISIFITATRSWTMIFIFILVAVYAKRTAHFSKIIFSVVILIVVGGTLIFSLLKLNIISEDYLKQSAWGRIAQVFNLTAEEDVDREIDTLSSRIEQTSAIFDRISDNPIFGYGFSDISVESYNNNFGFLNTILMFGIVGFSLFIFLFFAYFQMISYAKKKIGKADIYYDSLHTLLIVFLGILIGYFTTLDFFSLMNPIVVVFIMVFLAISNISANEATNKNQLNVQ